jgi:putative colanic acid biosynthesis acetyltransferase WcaF
MIKFDEVSAPAHDAARTLSDRHYMQLGGYMAAGFDRGRPMWFEAIWQVVQILLVSSPFSCGALRVSVLRWFGAQIGRGVRIKPGIRVKFPWRLHIGNDCWIGEDVWFDNLAVIHLGDDCCVSQSVYLCTGSHDWRKLGFDLMTRSITLEDEVWLAARSVVGPGVTAGRGAVLALGSVATRDLLPGYIHQGVPAVPVKQR